jgi:class 3 adenylate cyclase/tetratricopeptide (TPR) repeat protein
MKCRKCSSDNREAVKFCEECGAKLELECPACKAIIPFGKKFCGECGHTLKEPTETPAIDYSKPQSYTPKFLADKILTNRSALEGERKLVTVLFADVANYTAMAEKLDPEEVHQIMDGCFNILMDEIHRFEGTINQFTGDGVMALFGAPLAHEGHAQRACYAALSIQKILENYSEKIKHDYSLDFKMRAGLNSGTVVVASIGDDLRMDYTAIGDTTNLASRMESMAQPGTILLSANSHKLVRDFFEFESLGKLAVKGKEEAQAVYKLIRATAVQTRIEAAAAKGLTTFVGRSRQQQALEDAYEKTQSGSGQVVGLVGEAGVGKSRLLLELKNILPKGEYTYIEGRCLQYGGNMLYLPILDILRSFLGIEEGDREFIIKKKLQEKLLQLDEQFKSHLPPLQDLLSLKIDDEKYPQLNPGQKKINTFEAIRDVLIRDSQNRPVVMAVEDLHWIDKISEEFLNYLIDWLPNTGMLLVLLYRPEYTHQWGSKSYYSKIGVDQLSMPTSVELVHAILEGDEVAPELRELILSRAGGNPLFVEELTCSFLENGSIRKKDHQYALTRKASEIQVPDTIQAIIAARIDRVEENLKRIMQMASVIGREFSFRLLQTIMGMREELKSQLLNLQGLEFISEIRLFPELEYIFKHALTQEVAYSSLLQKRRREIHEKIGAAIEALYPDRLEEYCELLAYHYRRSDNNDKTFEYLNLANLKTAKLNAVEDAKVYFDEAMQLLDSLPDTVENQKRRISLLINNYDVFELLFRHKEYLEFLKRYEQMAIDLKHSELLGAFYGRLGLCEWWFGQLNQSAQTLTKAIELCKASGSVENAVWAYISLQWTYLYKADFDKVLTLQKTALPLLDKQFNLRLYAWELIVVSNAHQFMGCWNEAISEAQKVLKAAEEFSDNSVVSLAAWTLSFTHLLKLDFVRAIEYGRYAVDKAPTPADKAWAQGTLAFAWCRTGELDKGIGVLASAVQMYQAGGWVPGVVYASTFLGEAYWLNGMYDEARKIINESVDLASRCGIMFYLGRSNRILGDIARKTNPDQSSAYFEKSISILKEIKAENELALAYAGHGRLYKQQGRQERAREYLKKSLEILESLGTMNEPEKIREELAELPET